MTSRTLSWVCRQIDGDFNGDMEHKRQSELNEKQILDSVFIQHVVFRYLCRRQIQSRKSGTQTSKPLFFTLIIFVTHHYIKILSSCFKNSLQIEFRFFQNVLFYRIVILYLIIFLILHIHKCSKLFTTKHDAMMNIFVLDPFLHLIHSLDKIPQNNILELI